MNRRDDARKDGRVASHFDAAKTIWFATNMD